MNIGLNRGTVLVQAYDPAWIEVFDHEKRNLERLLGDFILEIEHIGSTAVPGLASKPIIDMLMAVRSLSSAMTFRTVLEKAGYEYRANGSGDLQVLFAKGSEARRTHHLHVTEYGSTVWVKAIAFRDFLRRHPDEAWNYGELKKRLATQFADDRAQYTARKASYIDSAVANE